MKKQLLESLYKFSMLSYIFIRNDTFTGTVPDEILFVIVIFRDVKPKHILIDSKGNVKLTGFRFMIELNHHLDCVFDYDTHLQNQIYYLAPEVLAQNMHGYTAKSDIYMLGISICEAINGVMPFAELEPLEMLLRKLNGQVPRPVDKLSLQDDENMGIDISKCFFSNDTASLIER